MDHGLGDSTVISVATMEATQQKENKYNKMASDYEIKHKCEVHPQNVNSLKIIKQKSSCACVLACV